MHQQLYETAGNTGLDDSLNLVVGSIREVGDGPARVDEDFVIERVDELGKDGECGLDLWGVSTGTDRFCLQALTVCQSG